jgi:DNA processing protein
VTPTVDERTAWIVLASVPGIGEVTFAELVGRAGGAASVLEHARGDRLDRLDRPNGQTGDGGRPRGRRLDAELRHGIAAAARGPQQLLERLAALGIWTLTPLDAGYPGRLRDLDPVPPILYGWGEASVLAAPRSVAMVGTRRPTAVGRLLAARLVSALVTAGTVVVSGMAIGIDGAAHAATVESGGVTVAVLGGGHAHPGPRAHGALLRALLAGGGCVVSELPPDAVPTRGTFPRRNRIISALADAVVVVEAPRRSGALITARHALEQGRPLFVAPGRPGDPTTAGCLALLRETPARPITGPEELLVDLGFVGEEEDRLGSNGAPHKKAFGPRRDRRMALALLDGAQREVAARICQGPVGADALVVSTGLPPGVVSGALTLLQLRGWIQPMGAAYLPAGPLLGS